MNILGVEPVYITDKNHLLQAQKQITETVQNVLQYSIRNHKKTKS